MVLALRRVPRFLLDVQHSVNGPLRLRQRSFRKTEARIEPTHNFSLPYVEDYKGPTLGWAVLGPPTEHAQCVLNTIVFQ